jgi:hypothetical protein
METTRDVREQRAALYGALVAYLEKLFLDRDRTHYASRRWWRTILIGYPKISAAVLLLLTIYFMLRKNPEYDFDVLRCSENVIDITSWIYYVYDFDG